MQEKESDLSKRLFLTNCLSGCGAEQVTFFSLTAHHKASAERKSTYKK